MQVPTSFPSGTLGIIHNALVNTACSERLQFKCPCHGSGYDSEGINFEGPAPRPMDRAHVQIAPDGQILVDVSKLYSWPKGQPSKFNEGDGSDGAWLKV